MDTDFRQGIEIMMFIPITVLIYLKEDGGIVDVIRQI